MSSPSRDFERETEEFQKSFPKEVIERLQADGILIPFADGEHPYDGASLKCTDSTTLVKEYSSLEELQRRRKLSPLPGSEKAQMNRYGDVLPSFQEFKHMFFSEDHSERPYFNGNEVLGDDGQAYFLTQAPVPPAFATFWNMVYFSNVRFIVMLTNLTERGRAKAHRYWPARQGKMEGSLPLDIYTGSTARDEVGTFDVLTDNLRIHSVSARRVSDAIMRREMTVSLKDVVGSEHKVVQYQYLGWPDHGVPESTEEIIRLINFTLQRPEEAPLHPIVVHCSAGIGRTGTFIASHMEISKIALANGTKDMSANVMLDCDRMRRVRVGTIQSADQYMFVFRTIQDYAQALPVPSGEKKDSEHPEFINNRPKLCDEGWRISSEQLRDTPALRYRRSLERVTSESAVEGRPFEIRKKLCFY